MGELHLSVPLGDKRNQMKVGSFSRHSTVQPLKKTTTKKPGKKDVWEGSKPRTLVVSENMFTCLYMSRYILFDMCIAFHLSTPLFSPFFFSNIYIKKSILNSMSRSISSTPKGYDKKGGGKKNLTRSMSSSPFIHSPNDCGCQFIQCQQ